MASISSGVSVTVSRFPFGEPGLRTKRLPGFKERDEMRGSVSLPTTDGVLRHLGPHRSQPASEEVREWHVRR
jgi:hypothetical protein